MTCLRFFEKSCSKRSSVHPSQWPFIFYLLSSISMVKSIMLSALCLRSYYDHGLYLHDLYIESTYTALVSIFSWATGSFDLLLGDYGRANSPVCASILQEARALVRIDKWTQSNIKSTREFLMRLGDGLLFDGTFNGFIVHEQGIFWKHPANHSRPVPTHYTSLITRNTSVGTLKAVTMQDLLESLTDDNEVDTTDCLSNRMSDHTGEGEAALMQDTSNSASALKIIMPKASQSGQSESKYSESHSFRSVM
jgi:hypothetical protein